MANMLPVFARTRGRKRGSQEAREGEAKTTERREEEEGGRRGSKSTESTKVSTEMVKQARSEKNGFVLVIGFDAHLELGGAD